jgi:hypothetical protein
VYTGQIWQIEKPYEHVTFSPFAVRNTYEHPAQTGLAQLPRFKVHQAQAPFLVSFAEDENKELYAVTFGTQKGQTIFKLTAGGAPVTDTLPERLSQTGCVDPADPSKPAAGLVPYDINAPFWSDGADKSRWLALPDGKQITVNADGDWDFPAGSVLMKSFKVGGKLVETRFLVRHEDGGWGGYTYAWQDDQKDALRANPQGETRPWGSQSWRYPSRTGCLTCHTTQAGSSLGPETRQMNKSIVYPATNRLSNQIKTLAHIGMLANAPATPGAFAEPFGSAPVPERARVYLHTNCSQCHRGQTPGPDLHVDTEDADMRLCDFIVPGNPGASKLIRLMNDPDPSLRMPKLGGNVIDGEGVKLLEQWIGAKTSCP